MRAFSATALLCLICSAFVGAAGSDEAVEGLNRMVERGQFADAALGFEAELEAEDDLRRRALISYNLGVALYSSGSYDGAREAFEEASLLARDLSLEAKATLNLGNSYVQAAQERSAEGDLQASAESLEAAISAYRRVLAIDPEDLRAARNIEVARMVLKGVIDEIEKQQAIQELQRHIRQTLEELLGGQAELNERSAVADPIAPLEAEQGALEQRARALGSDFDELLELIARVQAQTQQQPPDAGPYARAREHVETAGTSQNDAARAMRREQRAAAVDHQIGALADLEEALRLITPPEDEDQQSEQEDQQPGSEPEQEEKDSVSEQNPAEGPQEAVDILQEEEDARTRRAFVAPQAASGGKDW